ncbi:ATP-binding cassette domain-containing protein [Gordonia sp. GW1C4-4]|uniref:ATP-binding cassette domain-containing protein n=1 Tax=Gordonia tangerina TaxID=2911060 RepID=A0ABS9DQ20_9ACTN|nr:ATP-binding cassette domain-containing protein [Gordonia tangerina]
MDDRLISRTHAQLTRTASGLRLQDLQSSNGTYVSGHRIHDTYIDDGAVITCGNTDFVVDGQQLRRLPTATSSSGDGVRVEGVSLVVDRGLQLLEDISFTAAPGTVTAVIGPSGAGKSTLSSVIAGLATPSSGHVFFDGHDVHADYDALRTRIGMVPQHDVLHHTLTLRRALSYAAELRLPQDFSPIDRDQVIDGVLTELDLTAQRDTRIDRLSGGQRKRASVAMELLTSPALLILDEPTSGLDPALDRQVMVTLRRLADAGRSVLVVTHSLTHLDMCDQVLLLAPGGKTAFCGPAHEVSEVMGSSDWADIFGYVAAHPDTAHHQHRRRRGGSGTNDVTVVPHRRSKPSPPPPTSSAAHQASTVARRQCRLIIADRGYLAFLAVMPIVLGLLTLVIPGDAGFTVATHPDTAGEAVQILIILTIGATFMGTALTVRDLVGERAIYHREHAVGLRPGAYLTAKIAVYIAATTGQTAIMLAITYLGKGTPTTPSGAITLTVVTATTAAVGVLVGLAISATVHSTEQTMPPLVIAIIAQLVFCGGLFQLTTPVVAQLSWLFPSHWGYALAAGAVDLPTIAPAAPQTHDTALFTPNLSSLVLSGSALLLTATVLITYTSTRLNPTARRHGQRTPS